MDTSTLPMMPMPNAVKGPLPMGASTLPPAPLPLPPMPGGPAQAGPLPMGPGAPQPAPTGPLPMPQGAPMPPVPQQPPWKVRLQPDGSSIYYTASPDGNEVILGVNKPPALPKALQQPKQ